MRLNAIKLSWFRGAATSAILTCNLKSVAIYGENGAGKSSFVDGIEYFISNGKIGHLSHEYSGSRQELAIINTHTPADLETNISIEFAKGMKATRKIAKNGSSTPKGEVDLGTWNYARTVLRQDELANFIRNTKGEKYSALLPLLGLGHLETAAENLRQLVKEVQRQTKLQEKLINASNRANDRRKIFADANDEKIVQQIDSIFAKYFSPDKSKAASQKCTEILQEIGNREKNLDSDSQRHFSLQELAKEEVDSDIKTIKDKEDTLKRSVEPLIREKLKVVEAASAYAGSVSSDEENLICPACGQAIETDGFKSHVTAEFVRLQEIDQAFKIRNEAISSLLGTISRMKRLVGSKSLKAWSDSLKSGSLAETLSWLEKFSVSRAEAFSIVTDLPAAETHCLALIKAADDASKSAPLPVTELSEHKRLIEGAKAALSTAPLYAEIKEISALIGFLEELQGNIRDEIRSKSKQIVSTISSDIQDMWAILHPSTPITDVRLYLPEEDKAIDIALRFHERDQDSPRLTLSEGYRNSLGLCIFLALANREAANDRPLILDDVVVSFDRNHRGMLVELLEQKFSGRQVIIFTHDRDWFADLRRQLDESRWNFRALLPFESPEIGIRWSDNVSGFEDARAQLKLRPDSAGNDARKTMDVEISAIAEKLKIRLPHLRGEKNDRRTSAEFLKQLIGDSKRCFEKNSPEGYACHTDGGAALEAAEKLLITWGNRGSHTQDVARSEATKLIEACERALGAFACDKCSKKVWFSDAASPELLQCSCGGLRWRYGKG